MRRIMIALTIAAAALAGTGVAEAHHRGHHGHHGGYYGGHPGRHHGGYHRGRGHYRHGYRGHRRDNDGWKYVAGALVLGATIAAVTAPRERVVVRERVIREPSYASDTWYRLDRYGNCTRVQRDGYGREFLTDVDPSYCY